VSFHILQSPYHEAPFTTPSEEAPPLTFRSLIVGYFLDCVPAWLGGRRPWKFLKKSRAESPNNHSYGNEYVESQRWVLQPWTKGICEVLHGKPLDGKGWLAGCLVGNGKWQKGPVDLKADYKSHNLQDVFRLIKARIIDNCGARRQAQWPRSGEVIVYSFVLFMFASICLKKTICSCQKPI
jgi:hypothetical protein